MTRAEQAALKFYPKSEGIRELKGLSARPIFIQGYEQAEKDFLEKAITWLKENGDYYTWYNEFEGESGITEGFIEEFKKAMEE